MDDKVIKCKHWIIVREPPVFIYENKTVESNVVLNSVLLDKGISKITAVFNKNVFETDGKIEAEVSIDNSQSELSVTGIELNIIQAVTLKFKNIFKEY